MVYQNERKCDTMETRIAYRASGKTRKELAQAVSDVLNTIPRYMGVPSYSYAIGGCVLDREGTLIIGDQVDANTAQRLISYLQEKGYEGEQVSENTCLTIAVPRELLEGPALDRLLHIFEKQAPLFKKAFSMDDLPAPVVTEDKISFPWFPDNPTADEANAYTFFISKLCSMAQTQKRVSSVKHESDNDKFAFRTFLLRLGFIGDEYKSARKVLLQHLKGNGAFRYEKVR